MKTASLLSARLLLSGLLVFATPGSAWAQEDFERSVETIRQLLESQRYEEALERLGRLKPLVRDPNQRHVVSLYEGLILSNMGRRTQDRAQAAFKSALLLEPHASLPVKVPPRLERSFEEVRARVLKELAARPPSARGGTAPDAPSSPVKDTAPPPVEPGHGLAGAPAELDSVDRLRLVSKWPVLGIQAATDFDPLAVSFQYKFTRPRVLVPAVTGGALLASSGVFWGLARREQSKLRNEDFTQRTPDDATRTAARGKRYQNLGLGLAATGGVALGVATVLYLLQGPKTSGAPGLGATGTSALLQGTWQ